jgi:tetratricopeptide (TPR) repeat protein
MGQKGYIAAEMFMRTVRTGAAVLVMLAGAGLPALAQTAPGAAGETVPLPVPPVPPRIAEGAAYETCLGMLPLDPSGARAFAEAWPADDPAEADGSAHCLALAQLELGDIAEGAALLERLGTGSTAPAAARAAVLGQAAQAWMLDGDAARALAASDAALSLSPGDLDLLTGRAMAALALDRFDEAVADLSVVLEQDRSRPDALVLRATAWRRLGRLDRATDDIGRALILDPDNAEALLERGVLRQRANDRGGAQADWQRAMELAPDTPTADLAQQNLSLLEAGPDQR